MSIDYGLTATGFKAKTFDKIKEDLLTRAREYYGGSLDERSTNPLIKFIEDVALEIAYSWQVMQQVFSNLFLSGAGGVHLDKLGFELGLDRKEGTSANVVLKITGTVGTIVPTGSQFRTAPITGEQAVTFATIVSLTIGQLQELYVGGPSQTDTFDDGDGPGGAGNPFTLTEEAFDDGSAICTFNDILLSEVAHPGPPVAGQFMINYGASKELEIGNSLTPTDIVTCIYTYPAAFVGTSAFTLNKVPVDPVISLFRGATELTEVPSAPGANEFSVNYITGEVTLGQVILITDTFSATYLDSTALYDEVASSSVEIGIDKNVDAQKITVIVTPIAGISTVTNELAAAGGTDTETDTEYRERLIGVSRTQWTDERIEAEVESIEGVREAKIISSFTIDEFVQGDEIGVSPLTFELTRKPFEPLKRVEIQHLSGSTVLVEVIGAPGTGEFQVDYPSEVPSGPWVIEIFDTDLGVNDKLVVIYSDEDIGEGFFNCLVIGDETPLPTDVKDEVNSVLLEVKPVSIGFLVIEADIVLFDTDSIITLDEGFGSVDVPAIESEMETRMTTIINSLELEEQLVRNEVVKEFMSIDGVNDITQLKFTLYDETHVFSGGVFIYALDWAQGSTILYVKSLDKQTDYPYTFNPTTNEITLTGGTPSPGETFLIKYESLSGNIAPRAEETLKRNEVDTTT
jgi:hypothetical protein